MIYTLANLFLIVAYVAFFCYLGYRILIYLMDKMFFHMMTSRAFTILWFFLCFIFFFVGGWLQLADYRAGEMSESAWHIPFNFGFALMFVVAIYFAYKKEKWED